jgi:hypothetical protein
MVTSALYTKSFVSNGSTWQLLGEIHIPEEEDAASWEVGSFSSAEVASLEKGIGSGVTDTHVPSEHPSQIRVVIFFLR